jgi:hypothetical protein
MTKLLAGLVASAFAATVLAQAPDPAPAAAPGSAASPEKATGAAARGIPEAPSAEARKVGAKTKKAKKKPKKKITDPQPAK